MSTVREVLYAIQTGKSTVAKVFLDDAEEVQSVIIHASSPRLTDRIMKEIRKKSNALKPKSSEIAGFGEEKPKKRGRKPKDKVGKSEANSVEMIVAKGDDKYAHKPDEAINLQELIDTYTIEEIFCYNMLPPSHTTCFKTYSLSYLDKDWDEFCNEEVIKTVLDNLNQNSINNFSSFALGDRVYYILPDDKSNLVDECTPHKRNDAILLPLNKKIKTPSNFISETENMYINVVVSAHLNGLYFTESPMVYIADTGITKTIAELSHLLPEQPLDAYEPNPITPTEDVAQGVDLDKLSKRLYGIFNKNKIASGSYILNFNHSNYYQIFLVATEEPQYVSKAPTHYYETYFACETF